MRGPSYCIGGRHIRSRCLLTLPDLSRCSGERIPFAYWQISARPSSSFVGSLSLITGALPAQYGLRTAAIIDIKTATFDNSGQIGVYGGRRQKQNYSAQYGGKTGNIERVFAGRVLEY